MQRLSFSLLFQDAKYINIGNGKPSILLLRKLHERVHNFSKRQDGLKGTSYSLTEISV